MLGLGRASGLSVVLTNAVRYADRADAPTVDVLDAARRLVPLDLPPLDRGNAEGYLKSGKEMHEVAEEIAATPGSTATTTAPGCSRTPARSPTGARSTRASDLGLGEVHFPEFTLRQAQEPGGGWSEARPRSRDSPAR